MATAQLVDSTRGFHVQYIDDIAVLVLNNGENRFNINSLRQFINCLDQVERNESAKALVILGIGKFFCNGLDLNWLSQQSPEVAKEFFETMRVKNMKLATFPMPTIAALNGHAYAAGGVLAMLCDCRVMRTEKGWFCLPEVLLKVQFSTTMIDLMKLKAPSPQVRRDMVLFGKRYTAEEGLKVGLVDAICDESQLLECACKLAKQCLGRNGLDRGMVKTMKIDLYGSTLEKSSLKAAKIREKAASQTFDAHKESTKSKL